MKTLIVLVSLAFAASAEIAADGTGENKYEKRYVVFSGLDADAEEVLEWKTGWTSLFNALFGPKPYVIGWLGGAGSFSPEDGTKIGNRDDENTRRPGLLPK